MNAAEVRALVEGGLEGCEVIVEGGEGRYEVTVIGDVFEGMKAVRKQQLVYGTLNAAIADGRVHAVTIRTFTPDQWTDRA
ncbi:MAG: BolA/IbaG family iron-sulfur metabolism protein [Pseudomonadales bacterium]|nr:BolA/IbaG family iron-sulfur metabolism protein [Pseudomonadales bacterium]